MQKIINILLLLVAFISFDFAHAQEINSTNIKSVLEKKELSPEEEDQVYNAIDAMIIAKKEGPSMKELLMLCISYSKKDVSDAPHELLYRLKLSNKKEYESALKELSSSKISEEKEAAKKIKEYVKSKEDEAKFGNG